MPDYDAICGGCGLMMDGQTYQAAEALAHQLGGRHTRLLPVRRPGLDVRGRGGGTKAARKRGTVALRVAPIAPPGTWSQKGETPRQLDAAGGL